MNSNVSRDTILRLMANSNSTPRQNSIVDTDSEAVSISHSGTTPERPRLST